MDNKVILKKRLAKLKNYSNNMRRTLHLKNLISNIRKLSVEELNEIVNIKKNDNKENNQLDNNLGILCVNCPEDEDERRKGEELAKEHLNLCLQRAYLFKKMLEFPVFQMKNGFPVIKFNQYDVSLRQGNVILPRKHYFYHTLPNRAKKCYNDETIESMADWLITNSASINYDQLYEQLLN